MAKTKEELQELRKKLEDLSSKISDLSEEELETVAGGDFSDFFEKIKKAAQEMRKDVKPVGTIPIPPVIEEK